MATWQEADLDSSLKAHSEAAPVIFFDCIDRDIDRVEALMLNGLDGDITFSLVNQLGALGIASSKPPDVIAVTLVSAIPVADVLRGVYKAANIKTPEIIGINANMKNGVLYSIHPEFTLQENADEVERLKPLVENRDVVIVDEFVATGGTLRYALALTAAAGASKSGTIAGRWYHNFPYNILDGNRLTTRLNERFSEIGAKAFKMFTNN